MSRTIHSKLSAASFNRTRLQVVASTVVLIFMASTCGAAIIGGAGAGDITFHSTFFADALIAPSFTTGAVAIPPSPGALVHDVSAPGGAEHSYMAMSWTFSASDPDAFIPAPTGLPTTTRLEVFPLGPAPTHHAATMTGSFDITYALDPAGLPATLVPAQIYQIISYVSPIPGSPASASFDAHWDYTDVGFGLLGSQDIHYDAPIGLGVVSPVASLPLLIGIPAGHPTLKVTGFFKLTADSDDITGGPPPFDTMIAVVPEPNALALASFGAIGVLLVMRARTHKRLARYST